MNTESVLLITKDAMCSSYLPCYGNSFWEGKTPNMDCLVGKGTLFTNCFTVAPSSAMSYLSMFTGKYPYQQEIKTYIPLSEPYAGTTFFDKAYDNGFECHVLWDENWVNLAQVYSECYGEHTTIHSIKGLRQPVGSHYKHEGVIMRDEKLERATLSMIKDEISRIANPNKKVFLWCHLPHVLNGRTSYGDDIDLFDQYIGMFREFFSDDNIFISSDHGNMNGQKSKLCYGFDVYENAIRIPLIAPRIDGLKQYEGQFCNVDFYDLIMNRTIKKRDYIFSDTAYYAQPHRKLVVIKGKYRYIYNKAQNTEELYDIEWDPNENMDLADPIQKDIDRHVSSPKREYYFYPEWDEVPRVLSELRAEKDRIWRNGNTRQNLYNRFRVFAGRVYHMFFKTSI